LHGARGLPSADDDVPHRYNGTAWHFPPEEDLPQNSEEERAIVEENFERYKEEYDKMWNDGTDTLGEFGFDIEGSKPTPVRTPPSPSVSVDMTRQQHTLVDTEP